MMRKFLPLMAFFVPGISFLTVAQSSDIPANTKPQYGFIENKGQIINQENQPVKEVLYLLNTPGLNVQLRKGGFSYDTYVTDNIPAKDKMNAVTRDTDKTIGTNYEFHRVDISLEGANANCNIVAEKAGTDYLNYYTTGVEQGVHNVHHYRQVTYKDIYPGIDLEFVANASETKTVEYNFIVHPGADASKIRMRYTGANSVDLENNAIRISVKQGSLIETIPASFIASTHQSVNVTYMQKETNTFGYNVPAYDRSQTLIIDPTPGLAWATYYGGNAEDAGSTVATGGTSLYMVGSTLSSGNIATTNAHQSSLISMADVFLVRFSLSGTRQWATYYGGSGNDIGVAVSASSNGDVFIGGQAASSSVFASSGAVLQPTYSGNPDGFIAKFNSAGVRRWGTYIGKNGFDVINSLAVDGNGDPAFAGTTSSDNMNTMGASRTFRAGNTDGFTGMLEGAGGTAAYFVTYTGSDNNDDGQGVGVDAAGNVYVTGVAEQPISNNYIATVGCHQPYFDGGTRDMFLMKYDFNGDLVWGTYYGGSNDEPKWIRSGQKLAVTASGNVFIVGSTLSTNNISSSGSLNGLDDGFVAKFNTSGVRQWGRYVGTNGGEALESITLDGSGNVYVTGFTNSSSGIATSNAYQMGNNGVGRSAFATKLSGSNGATQWSTYIGGNAEEESYGIAVDANNAVYVCGFTSSNNSLATSGAYQASYGGGTADGFLVKLNDCSATTISGTVTQSPACTGNNNGSLTVNPTGGVTPYEYQLGSGSFQSSNIFSGLAGGSYTINIRDVNSCAGSVNTSVNQVPAVTTPVITGSTAAEELHASTYSTTTQTGAVYQWTVTGGMIASGQGTDAITVNWGTKGTAASVKVVVSQGAPCVDSSTIAVNLTPSGISNITMETDIQVYPNPATDKLTIRMQADPKGEEIRLFDNYGKLVMRAPANKEQTIDISALPAGVYHLNIGAWSRNISKL